MGIKRITFILLAIGMAFLQAACSGKKDIPDSVLWINGTHAVLTKINNGDVNLFGTMADNAINKAAIRKSLADSWGVTTRQEMDDMIDSLVIGRHNPQFLEKAGEYGITEMSRGEFEKELKTVDDRELVIFFRNMFDAYQAFGEKAILGWDLSRATQLCAYGYIAGFYTYDEAVDKALPIGRKIQNDFASWDDFFASYMYGYLYWSEDDIDDPKSDYAQRVKILQDLKADKKSPLNLAWRLDLSK